MSSGMSDSTSMNIIMGNYMSRGVNNSLSMSMIVGMGNYMSTITWAVV